MFNLVYLPVADHNIGFVTQDGGEQIGDGVAGVLVVGIGVDDEVGTKPEAGVEAGLKGASQPQVFGMADDVGDVMVARNGRCAIGTPIVNHQRLNHINPRNVRRQIRQRFRQRFRFVITRNLDNQFHCLDSSNR